MKSFMLILVLSAAARAGERSSANYTIATETIGDGGGSAASTSYSSTASAGGIAGISSVAAPAETAKHGFIAQLTEPTGLVLTAAPLSMNEGATLQLGAWLALDDATVLAVPAAGVAWSTASGPLTIGSSGLAIGGAVHQNTSATAQGVHLGFTGTLALTILDALTDNFGAYADDGLADNWQVQYFGENNPLAAPGLDPDRDGQSNADEFNFLTHPADPASTFRPTSTRSGSDLVISFLTAPGRTYNLQHSDDLAPGSWTTTGLPAISGDGGMKQFTAPAAAPDRRFFRVVARP